MLTYNTQKPLLNLPEYGRNIQQMVDHCLTIENRDERTRCAYSVIRAMGNLFPELRDDPSSTHKLWDHLAIMSGFKLDIDYPCEIITSENLGTYPRAIPYPGNYIQFRHYGKTIENMIARAVEMPEGEERDALVMLIAEQMKKLQVAVNKDNVDDERIFRDLYDYSRGAIYLDTEHHKLHDYKIAPAPSGKKKKKK